MSLNPFRAALYSVSVCLLFIFPLHSGGTTTSGALKLAHIRHDLTPQEVFLSFNYRNFFDKVIIAYYEDGSYYLPVSEIFSSLNIPNNVNTGDLSLEGFYLEPENTYRFDFINYTVSLENKGTFTFEASQMLVEEFDYYVELEVLAEVFDLNFTVDLSNLLLQLETSNVLPIVEEFQRAERRRKQDRYRAEQNYYPLEYERKRDLLGGAFLDYSLSANMNEDLNSYSYNIDLGAEVLGGDLQGSAFGNYTDEVSNFSTNNLRWRYVLRNNDNLTQIFAGQTSSDGLIGRNFTGLRLTNEPIEPRFLYDAYELEGRAQAGSEVELYYNNVLYDFVRVTDNGQYRFLAPLTYGTSRLKLRIYGPDGRITEREERIQIPFNFLPKGEFSYHLNAGRLDNTIFGSAKQSNIAQGDFSYGISNWLTQAVGVEYFNEFSNQTPLLYGSTTARLLDGYLVNLDVAPSAFYRISGNVVYPSSASWGLTYTEFSDSGIYNPLGNDQEFSGNVFLPFRLGEIPFNVRVVGNYAAREPLDNTSYSVDLNSRIDRFNLRLSYRDRTLGRFNFDPSNSSALSASATYLIARDNRIPRYLQNTFISGRLDYNPGLSAFERAEIQASRSVFENGRLQASVSRNFISDFNFVNLGLTIDFNAFRSTSTARHVRNQASFTQNIRGSIGYDDVNRDVILSNRQQVGRSAASVRLYVDANNSGNFDEGDTVIDDKAVRIGRAGVTSSSKNGILRFSQLQSYHRINMEINEAVIKNPLLVPKIKEFSIVTDPNQYKPINIPFYVSGVIEGKVQRNTSEGTQAVSGVRLYLEGKDNNFSEDMQTFSDGSFYLYEVPPGTYTLEIDSTQLKFINARTDPSKIEFEVKALAEGDFVEALNFEIVPITKPAKPVIAQRDTSTETSPKPEKHKVFYQLQLASYAGREITQQADERAEKILQDKFYIRYNPYTDLFALRSIPTANREDAIEDLLSTKTRSPFNEPAIVIVKDTAYSTVDLTPAYKLRMYTLQSRELAEQYARTVEIETGITTKIVTSSDSNTYTVQTAVAGSQGEVQNLMRRISGMSNLAKGKLSVMNVSSKGITNLYFKYMIEIVGIPADSIQDCADTITGIDVLPDGAEVRVDNNAILVSNLSQWSETIKLKRALDKALTEGTPILLLEQYQK